MKDFFRRFHKEAKKRQRKLVVKAVAVGLGVVLFWRGAWNLFDHLIFPQRPVLSASVSLLLGLLILYASNKLIDELM